MAGIFINYRRDDAPGVAGRLFDYLTARFPRRELFMDVDAMKPGLDFVKQLDAQVSQCHVLLAVIGPHWLDAKDPSGHRRLDNANDYVRIELAAALTRDIPVVPLLVDGAAMPAEESLPNDLKLLVRRHALELRHTRFSADANAILRALEELVPPRRRPWRLVAAGAAVAAIIAAGAVLWPKLVSLLRPAGPPTVQTTSQAPLNRRAATPSAQQMTAGVSSAAEGLSVAFGDTMERVRAAYDIRSDPTNGCASNSPCLTLAAPLNGVMFFFKKDSQLLYEIRADAPFPGSIEGVHIGDALQDVLARFGQPVKSPWNFGENKAYLFHVHGASLRCDINNAGKVATILYFND